MKQIVKVYNIDENNMVCDYGTGLVIHTNKKGNCTSKTTYLSDDIKTRINEIESELVEMDVPSFAEIVRQCFKENQPYYRTLGVDPTIGSRVMDNIEMEYGWNYLSPQYIRIKEIASRYCKFVRYMHEIAPQWENVGSPVYYADNSIEQRQVNKYGETRRVMLSAPSGDACY